MAKPIYLRRGWRKLGASIRRRYPVVSNEGVVLGHSPDTIYKFTLYVSPTKHLVKAGCRLMTIPEYRIHAWDYYSGRVRDDQKNIGRYVATKLILEEFEDRLDAYRKRQKRSKRKGR